MTQQELEEYALLYYGSDPPETIMDKLWMAQSNLRIAQEKGLSQTVIDGFTQQVVILTMAWDKKAVIV